MLTPVTHILQLQRFLKARLLPIDGKVLVHIGQQVHSTDVIAEAVLKPFHIQLDLKRVLGQVTSGKARKMIQRRIGEEVAPGDIIASSGGLFERVLRAPQAGIIDYLSADMVMLQVQGPNHQLLAGIPGKIIEIIPDRGAVIEANGMRIQGAWGNDRINSGNLVVITDAADEEIALHNLARARKGDVIAGGFCEKSTVLKAIDKMDICGLVLGSMSARLCELARTLPIPIVLIDGFGNSPMNDKAYNLLKENEGKELSCLGTQLNQFTGDRPELFIEDSADGLISNDSDTLRIGQTVRILGYPYFGCTGTIEDIREDVVKFASGLRSIACTVKLGTGQAVVVPAINLDILE